MKTHISVFATAVITTSAAAAGSAFAGEIAITDGANPAFSPDGTRIAFQRLEGDVFKIGVAELPEHGRLTREGTASVQQQDSGRLAPIDESGIEWIEEGPGNAAYPAWTSDGALVYMAGNDTETAYEAWKKGSTNGYGLRLWKGGVKRDLTSGRCRDYTPCVSPDGKTVYFVTTRGVESESASFSKAAATRIAMVDLAQRPQRSQSDFNAEVQGAEGGASPPGEPQASLPSPRILLDAPNGNNSGYVQPAVSPDGTLLVWGQMDSFFDSWRICGMRLGTAAGGSGTKPPPFVVPITPSSLAALSPRWHPNGRLICFTGFHAGDPGWGVWVEDVQTGNVKRLATGENPCFSPDGAAIAYDRDGTVYLRPFAPDDWPDELLPDVRDDAEPERIAWSAHDIASETSFDIAGDARFAFGDGQTFFLRAKVRLGGGVGVRQLAIGDYAEYSRAFQLYVAGTDIWLATRGFDGKWLGVKVPVPPRQQADNNNVADGAPAEISIVAARTPKRLVLSVNGGEPKSVLQGPFLALDTPVRLMTGAGLQQGETIDALEIGTGWPSELPKAPTREDLFR